MNIQPTPIVQRLLFLNIASFILKTVGYGNMIDYWFGVYYYESPLFHVYQLLTYMFVHGSFQHLLGNMLGLWFMGPILEMVWGEKRFATYYFTTGIGAGIIYMISQYFEYKQYDPQSLDFMMQIPMMGASGAIFGILLAVGYLFPNTELRIILFPIPIKAKYFVTLSCLYEFYSGTHRIAGDNVAHWTHLGGALVGFLLIKYWQTKRDRFY